MKLPLMIRLNLLSSMGAAATAFGESGPWSVGDGGATGVVSVASFFPNKPPSPNKLVTDDAIPKWAPMALLNASSVPPDLSFIVISKASLWAGSSASGSFNRFWIAGMRYSRTLVWDRSWEFKQKRVNIGTLRYVRSKRRKFWFWYSYRLHRVHGWLRRKR